MNLTKGNSTVAEGSSVRRCKKEKQNMSPCCFCRVVVVVECLECSQHQGHQAGCSKYPQITMDCISVDHLCVFICRCYFFCLVRFYKHFPTVGLCRLEYFPDTKVRIGCVPCIVENVWNISVSCSISCSDWNADNRDIQHQFSHHVWNMFQRRFCHRRHYSLPNGGGGNLFVFQDCLTASSSTPRCPGSSKVPSKPSLDTRFSNTWALEEKSGKKLVLSQTPFSWIYLTVQVFCTCKCIYQYWGFCADWKKSNYYI